MVNQQLYINNQNFSSKIFNKKNLYVKHNLYKIQKKHRNFTSNILSRNAFYCFLYILTILIKSYKTTFIKLKTADDLAVPICYSNNDCVIGGVCIKDQTGKGRCFCSSSCTLSVPVQCTDEREGSCMTMGEHYTSTYNFSSPLCYQERCICPPIFEPYYIQPPIQGFKKTLAMKCDKRELKAIIVASPSNTVYRGTTNATIYCCINVDPRQFISKHGVYFYQNGTRKCNSSNTPYDNFSLEIDTLFTVPTCWSYHINNVQLTDSGTYTCIIQPINSAYRTINVSLEFFVKTFTKRNLITYRKIRQKSNDLPDFQLSNSNRAIEYDDWKSPKVIQNLTVIPNTTSAKVSWNTQDNSLIQIDLSLSDRYFKTRQILQKKNVKSPVFINNLQPGTPYTLFVMVMDDQTELFRLSKQFTTNVTNPDPPLLEAIRVVNGENVLGQMCEIEWRPPRRDRASVKRYYIKISGKLRYVSPNTKVLTAEDFPQGVDSCTNYNQNEEGFMNVTSGSKRFFACKYGPLKPNRNYAATLWVVNEAGKSRSVTFHEQCVMDYAQPDHIEPPKPMPRSNTSSFILEFDSEPDETNGPIQCYYLAIVPLPTNVSTNNLLSPEFIAMDTFDKTLQNNLQESSIEKNRFFAYIAESYVQYPKRTVIGDGQTSGGMEPCNALYLARYHPVDSALLPTLKYTGFLIARVDRDMSLYNKILTSTYKPNFTDFRFDKKSQLYKGLPLTNYLSNKKKFFGRKSNNARRQLSNVDPAYGFSDYFNPVSLQETTIENYTFYALLIVIFLILILLLAITIVLICLYRKGIFSQLFSLFCIKSKYDLLKVSLPQAIKVENLPREYILKHRDSNFYFNQEFEMLPRGKDLDHSSSFLNARKNRYNDIKANEATRVRLRKIPGDFLSDYINANFIQGYRNRKVFIASQGPLEHTVNDFWRMVWEQGSRIIIMVTNLRERTRDQCAKYWPDEDANPLIVRNLEISTIRTKNFADYVVREFEVYETEQSDSIKNLRSLSPGINSIENRTTLNTDNARFSPLSNNSTTFKESLYMSNSNHIDADYANIPKVRQNSIIDKRHIYQYHFTNWNDYKAPECYTLLRLIQKLRKLEEYNCFPVIVHCSAGVGRTGTFIAIDYLMDQIREEGKVDVFKCVADMRQQRNMMVQSVEQYVFIYKALAEYQLYGESDLNVINFLNHYSQLRLPLVDYQTEKNCFINSPSQSARSNSIISPQSKFVGLFSNSSNEATSDTSTNALLGNAAAFKMAIKTKLKQMRCTVIHGTANTSCAVFNNNNKNVNVISNNNSTLLDFEFKNMSKMLEKPPRIDWAHKPENANRNRFRDAVPFDFNRFILSHTTGYDNTYINATSIKGYFYPYIMAQDPIDAENAFDFWRMIRDSNSSIIVRLTAEQDFKKSEKYWPESNERELVLGKHNELVITTLIEEFYPHYTYRKLQYCFKDNKQKLVNEIEQYGYQKWKNQKLDCVVSFVEFIKLIMVKQNIFRETITMHCRDGSSENGILCCVLLLLERLKSEQMIDVLRTVKSLKLQRPCLFTNIEQYKFCYNCIAVHLKNTKELLL